MFGKVADKFNAVTWFPPTKSLLSTGPTLPFSKPLNLDEGTFNLFEILTSSDRPVIVLA